MVFVGVLGCVFECYVVIECYVVVDFGSFIDYGVCVMIDEKVLVNGCVWMDVDIG